MDDVVRLALVGCGSAKQDTAAPARDLYTSSYFSLKRRYAETECDAWYILSAKHGVVAPDTVIEPYDASLAARSDAYVGDAAAAAWGARVRETIRDHVLPSYPDRELAVVVLAGRDYARHLTPLADAVTVRCPFEGLGGLHGQMRWLSEETPDE